MKSKFITLVFAIVVMSFGISFGQSVSIDNATNIGGMWHGQPDSIMVGSTYVFNIRLTSNADAQTGITNGFRVYSPDGATWTTTAADTLGVLGKAEFDLFFGMNLFSITGAGADTVGFAGVSLVGSGMIGNFDDVVYSITIGPITGGAAAHGKTICIDSTFYPPAGSWIWTSAALVETAPAWSGPHCYTVVDEATDFEPLNSGLPNSFALAQNYPNPFNPTTTINFDLPRNSDVSLAIYNVTGQKVKEFTDENVAAGSHSFEWDASSVASGIYFYKLVAGDFTDTKKMMLLK